MFCTLFLGDDGVQPATYDIFLLLEETSGVSPRLQAQARQQPTFPVALLHLLQEDFNESFCQALERQQQVRWKNSRVCRGLLRRGIFVLNWSPSQGGSYRQIISSLRPQRPAARYWQHPRQKQAPPPPPQTQGRRRNQEAEKNPHPTPQI